MVNKAKLTKKSRVAKQFFFSANNTAFTHISPIIIDDGAITAQSNLDDMKNIKRRH
tara:strand:+ start:988 stop:1155 length:168 start_codon:yes stop_codon:yes gene_type:complete